MHFFCFKLRYIGNILRKMCFLLRYMLIMWLKLVNFVGQVNIIVLLYRIINKKQHVNRYIENN